MRSLCLLLLLAGCSSLPLNTKFRVERHQVYKEVDGESLDGDFYIPDGPGPLPTVVLVHGGGWNKRSGDMSSIAKDLARSGFFVFNITYRLAPQHHFPAPVEDVKDAVAYLKREAPRLKVDPGRIGAWGYSAGANLVMLAGLDPRTGLKALVGGGTPTDLTPWPDSDLVVQYIGGSLEEKRAAWEAASPIRQIQRGSPPIFLYHGVWDQIVDIEQTRSFARALRAKRARVRTHEVAHQGHLWVYFFSQESVDLAIAFLNRELGETRK